MTPRRRQPLYLVTVTLANGTHRQPYIAAPSPVAAAERAKGLRMAGGPVLAVGAVMPAGAWR